MKLHKPLFQAIFCSLLFTGCNQAVPLEANTETNTEISAEKKTIEYQTLDTTRLGEIDKLIETIDSEAENIKKEFGKSMNVGLYACSTKDFGQKKETFCFDGGMEAREILAYYGKDKILKVAIFSIMKYNASPANLAEFDESKTSILKYKLVFKKHNDPMYTGEIESVYDENNEETPLTEDIKSQWNSFTAVVPPY
ncbi:hypothetical protein Fleli_0984 [Bernardetia litoralis DSM 6794]|uniref:Uncharacterized protein n=1 Tax=Bernardetia litoralis (strain ATCC 23117 / DSM 6794 / NBRC 15988 / NCIMB 1366 / Fx l1 / Sio-4) TaxID=880071 RepID=I4AHJ7_BERLS|nr:hypothetical protein [Bernardetia litoralis]AFM03432.1 hypothetical protein Fleli_0984 [Bernardetia litoralis DSM 6794]